jgi:hypothetical protein
VFDLVSPITLVVMMRKGLEREDFTLRLKLVCGADVVHAGERHFVVARPECDPNLLAKALREYETARSFALAGVAELDRAANDLRDFRDDYVKESAEIGAEKLRC